MSIIKQLKYFVPFTQAYVSLIFLKTQRSYIISNLLSLLERRFRAIQIIIITNFAFVSCVGIKGLAVLLFSPPTMRKIFYKLTTSD